MRDRIRPSPEAIDRIRQLGEKKILQFLDEVTLGSVRNLAESLPTVHGFRPNSEAGIKQQKMALAKRLANKAGGADRDHFALYVMWRAWAWEQLGDADAVDHLLDDFEKSFKNPRASDETAGENERAAAIKLFSALKDLSFDNKCSREKISRLLEFSPVTADEVIKNLVATSKSTPEIERDAAISNLPNRLHEDELEIHSIKERVSGLSTEVKAATEKLRDLDQKLGSPNPELRAVADAVERIRAELDRLQEAGKHSIEAISSLDKRIDGLNQLAHSHRQRHDGLEGRLEDAVRSVEDRMREMKATLEPLEQKLRNISPVGADAVNSIAKELESLTAKVVTLPESFAIQRLGPLEERVAALERPASPTGATANASAAAIDGSVSATASRLRASKIAVRVESPTPLTDAEKIVASLAAGFQSLGLKKSGAVVLAEDVAAATLTGQIVSFKGALSNTAARRCAEALSEGHAWVLSIPIGLVDGYALNSAMLALEAYSGPNVQSIILEGLNRSALDAIRDTLFERVIDRAAVTNPSLFCFASLSPGIASLPVEPEHLELGPIFDLDCLDWRIAPDVTVSALPGTVATDVAKALRLRLSQDDAGDVDEALRVVRKYARKRNVRVERNAVTAYAALRGVRHKRPDPSPMQSLAFGWLIPLWTASGVSKEDADSELDGGKCDAVSVDPRIAAVLNGDEFKSSQGAE